MAITGVISPNNTLGVTTTNEIVSLDINIKPNSGLEIYNDTITGTHHLKVQIDNNVTGNLLKLNSGLGLYCDVADINLVQKLISDITSSDSSLNIINSGAGVSGKGVQLELNISGSVNNTLKVLSDGLYVDYPSYISTQAGSTSEKIGIWVGNTQPTSTQTDILYFW